MHLFQMPERVQSETTKPIEATVLGCGVVQLGAIHGSTVDQIKTACQTARWTHEAAIVIAASSEGWHYSLYPTASHLEQAGFKVIAEAVNQRHEYKDNHKVKLWMCDVTNWPKPESDPKFTVAPPVSIDEYSIV